MTKVLSQIYFCPDKRRVLSRQKLYLWQLPPVIALRVCAAITGSKEERERDRETERDRLTD